MGFWGIPINVVASPTNPNDTDQSTIETVERMRVLARQCSSHPLVVKAVGEALARCNGRVDSKNVARAIYWWIKGHVTFEEDETILGQVLGYRDVQQELLISPPVLLSMPHPMGDCDDFSLLAATMLLCANQTCKFVVIACDDKQPWRFSHIYCSVYIPNEDKWYGFDCSHGNNLGWEYDGEVYRRMEWLV